jgi:hypothetical protein
VDERDVVRHWRNLFDGSEVTAETLAEAETLLDGLSGESPLHLRLANELEELKRGRSEQKQKLSARRKAR